MSSLALPPRFGSTIGRVFGDAGRAWLVELPEHVQRCRRKWDLAVGTISPQVSLNYLELTTTAAGVPVALKVGVPHPELFSEMEALRLFAGRGAVRLLDADAELGALLLPWLRPGTRLWEWGDNAQQTRRAAAIMRGLHSAPPPAHSLPMFADWLERAMRLTRSEWDPDERMPRDLLAAAEEAFARLAREGESVVLHGDLHHENILYDEQAGWLAIDPKGAIGPAALEVGRYLRNQLPTGPPERRAELVGERIAVFSAELAVAPETVAAAALVDCVLSHCWCFEDESLGDSWALGVELARWLVGRAGLG